MLSDVAVDGVEGVAAVDFVDLEVQGIEGATDDVGYRAVEKPHYISDLQSTILRQLGLNYKKMDFVLNGRPFHLVEEGLGPIEAILR